jgi:hypothetical protein
MYDYEVMDQGDASASCWGSDGIPCWLTLDGFRIGSLNTEATAIDIVEILNDWKEHK